MDGEEITKCMTQVNEEKEDQRQLGKTILQSKQVDICCYQINTKLAGGCLSKKQPTLELRTDENRTRLGS